MNSRTSYLDSVGTGTVTGSHIAVALGDGGSDSQVTVLAVHVVGAGTRIVTQPDAKVLDLQRGPLGDLLAGHDLSGGLLELVQLAQEVPETGLGHNVVWGEDPHFVQGGVGLLVGGQLAANDLEFLELKQTRHAIRMGQFTKKIPNECCAKCEVMFGSSDTWRLARISSIIHISTLAGHLTALASHGHTLSRHIAHVCRTYLHR